ncbi:Sporulenol synthase [Geobacillus sp. BCO2]|nr:Sporulenol synthase [Geobacillus sp. BCO2]
MTGRTLEYFGTFVGLTKDHPAVARAVDWLLDHQEADGSWYGRWGIYYVYGTWAAVTGLSAVGVPADHPAMQKAVHWLLSIQNADGGWGESCKSDGAKTYVTLGASTPVHTAWALDALIAAAERPTAEMKAGFRTLFRLLHHPNWTASYPVGQGMAGAFYIHYHATATFFRCWRSPITSKSSGRLWISQPSVRGRDGTLPCQSAATFHCRRETKCVGTNMRFSLSLTEKPDNCRD